MKCMIEGIERAIRTLCNVGNADTMRKHNHKSFSSFTRRVMMWLGYEGENMKIME